MLRLYVKNAELTGTPTCRPPAMVRGLCLDCLNDEQGIPRLRILPQWMQPGPPPDDYGVDGNYLLDIDLCHWFKVKGAWVS